MTLSITTLNTGISSFIMMNVAFKPIMLCVIMVGVVMLNVVMVNVVAPMYSALVVNKKFPEIKFSFLFHFVGFHFCS